MAPNLSKVELVALLHQYKAQIGFDIERLAASRGHRVVWTPAYHSDRQPIELLWAAVKNQIARLYASKRSLDETKRQLMEAITLYSTKEHCTNFIRAANAHLEAGAKQDAILEDSAAADSASEDDESDPADDYSESAQSSEADDEILL